MLLDNTTAIQASGLYSSPVPQANKVIYILIHSSDQLDHFLRGTDASAASIAL
jgi:hypothetical protein